MDEGQSETPTTPPVADGQVPHLDAESLVLAMPRRELYSIQGFTTHIEMRVIECLADETWYALPSLIHEDVDAKEVQIGLIIQRADQALVTEDGVLLHTTSVPPEVDSLGEGLASLRAFARAACGELMQCQPANVQLYGYINDDALVEIQPFFLLAYAAHVPAETSAPAGMNWVARDRLHDLPLDSVSALVASAWKPQRRSEQA